MSGPAPLMHIHAARRLPGHLYACWFCSESPSKVHDAHETVVVSGPAQDATDVKGRGLLVEAYSQFGSVAKSKALSTKIGLAMAQILWLGTRAGMLGCITLVRRVPVGQVFSNSIWLPLLSNKDEDDEFPSESKTQAAWQGLRSSIRSSGRRFPDNSCKARTSLFLVLILSS